MLEFFQRPCDLPGAQFVGKTWFDVFKHSLMIAMIQGKPKALEEGLARVFGRVPQTISVGPDDGRPEETPGFRITIVTAEEVRAEQAAKRNAISMAPEGMRAVEDDEEEDVPSTS